MNYENITMTLEEILEKFESSKPGSDFSISAFGKGYSEINLKWNGSQINLYYVTETDYLITKVFDDIESFNKCFLENMNKDSKWNYVYWKGEC